jgi:23S rRNA (cytosine1962-C5)-methyltransferase
MTEVRVNRKAAERVASGHPWIFASDLADSNGAQPGAAVKVIGPHDHALGIAHYSSASQIALRMLSLRTEEIDRDFYLARLRAAEDHRQRLVSDSNAYRVVHAEGDLLPALIVDRYGEYLAVQTLDQGMDAALAEITSCLDEIFHPRGILARNDVAVRGKEQLPLECRVIAGDVPEFAAIHMNGMELRADLRRGQKTGVFLDQRENYLAAARYARGRVLDCFTSTGGFALHLAARCESVEGIDSAAAALASARANASANGIGNVEFHEADVFNLLASHASARRQYSMVVLDPPAFAKSRRSVTGALTGYKEINLRALRLLAPGGILVTCSCSHHVSEAMFLETVAEASLDAGRTLRVLERRTQAQDHPILLTVPETHYLKCLILEVL